MTTYELLEEARKRYPIGTRVVCLCDDIEYTIGDFDHDGTYEDAVWCSSSDGWGVQLFKDGVWADTVESHHNDVSKILEIKPMFVEFVEWTHENYNSSCSLNEPRYSNVFTNHKATTTELFDLWIESKQTKK